MPDVLNDLSEKALIKAIEENLYAWTPLSHKWPHTELYTGEDVTWCLTDVNFPICNPIININMKRKAANILLDTLIAKARQRKISLQCWITQNTRPSNMSEYLTNHGFTKTSESIGMAIDLLNMDDKIFTPSGFQIIDVKDDTTLNTWSLVGCNGFGFPEHMTQSIFRWITMEKKTKQPIKIYLGLLNGKPVATSMYFLAEGVAGIYFVATLPEARNKGIGYAITQKPLLEALETGYRVGILQASEMGKPVYLRLGFKEYCRFGSYSWIYQPE